MKRRALSTVVGTVFAIIALTSTVTYITYSMGILDNYNQTILAKNQQSLDIGNEKFQVTGATIVNNKFNITVTNTGNIPINFTKIWIQNTTGVDWVRSYVPPSNIVTPGGILKNIGQNIPVSAVSTKSYNIKMVTSRGNSYQFYVNSPNLAPVPLQIIAAPSIVPTGFQTTLILTVTNNMTNNAALTNVIPAPLSITSNNGITSNCNSPTPASYSNIPVGTTAMFQWTCTVSGSVGTAITYNASLQSGYNHNYALSTITIGNVLFAEQSASSLGAQSLSQASNTNQELIFDQNHYSVPYGGYQMFSTQADNSTNNPSTDTFLQVDPNGESFYTNNGTDITISPGKWNATLRYISAPVPSSFSSSQYPDVIFHFESNFNKLGNSIGSGSTMTTHNNPGWTSTSGVNNTGAYTFANGNQYLDANVAGGYTDIPSGSTKTNTAMWFKTSASCAGTCTLLRIGDSNTGPYYIIYISNHNITFKFSDHNNNNGQGGQIDATCTKAVTVDDQKWHYLVAEKTGSKNCDLYIDGSHTGTTFTQGTSCSGDCSSVSGHFDIGRDQSSNNNYFSGNIDDLMHWNGGWNNNLSQTQVTDLLKTSYGANAHTVNMYIYETDQNGNCPSGGNGGLAGNCQNIIVQNLNYQLPFMDGWYYGGGGGTISYTTPSASSTTWGHYNYTATLGAIDVSTTQRIEFQTKFITQASGQLGMKMIIDNTGLADQYGQSLLETPSLTSPFTGYYSYLSYDSSQCCGGSYKGEVGNVYINNAGPDLAWVAPGSRAIFMTADKSSAYAGYIFFTPGQHSSQSNTDSAVIPVGTSAQLYFSTPYTQPGFDTKQGGSRIPDGKYMMYVYINGYDEEGHTMLSTEYFGIVRVYSK